MSQKDLQKIKGDHSDVTQRKDLPTATEEIHKLRRELDAMKQELSYIKHQSENAYAIAVDVRHRLNAHVSPDEDTDESER